jgi:glycosyltransferase involved in cell wall biosynthesis
MKILHLTAANENTGAGKATILTHQAIKRLGIESQVLLLKSDLNETNIQSYHSKNIWTKFFRFVYTSIERAPLLIYPDRKNQIFSTGLVGLQLRNHKLIKWADVIHIHWANHGFIDIEEIPKWNKKVVYTLRDMWAFTGGCHYAFECQKFINTCNQCPVLKSQKTLDLSTKVQDKKLNTLRNYDVTWVAISSWIKDLALKSNILKGKDISIIHSGTDVDVFNIMSYIDSKKIAGIRTNKKIIVVGAGNLRDKYKGFEYLVKSLNQINENILIITFGNASFKENEIPQEFIHFGNVDYEKLNLLYNCADVFFAPSIAEAMGKTFLEAQLCGIPVVCFDQTGPADIVKHLKTGYLAKFEDTEDLISGLNYCLNNNFEREEIRNSVKQEFSIENVAKKYIEIYEDSMVRYSSK